MNKWIKHFFDEYRFQLWLIGITNKIELELAITDRHEGLLKLIASDPKYAYYYALNVVRGAWSPGEKAVASDPPWVYYYAEDIVKGPFPKGEKAIASDPCYAYHYAKDIIKGPWPPGEKAIASDPYWKNKYEEEFNVKL